MRLLERIDIRDIVFGHFRTLYDESTNKTCWGEVFLFYILPILIIGWLQYHFRAVVTTDTANIILQTFAISGGFLVSALFIIVDKNDRTADSHPSKELLGETYYNVSFGVLLCFSIVMLCIVNHFFYSLLGKSIDTAWLGKVRDVVSLDGILVSIGSAIYYLSWLFTYSILMILKRLNRVFRTE